MSVNTVTGTRDISLRADAVMTREIEVIKSQLRRNRVTVYEGNAKFLDDHTLEASGDNSYMLLGSDNFVIERSPSCLHFAVTDSPYCRGGGVMPIKVVPRNFPCGPKFQLKSTKPARSQAWHPFSSG